MEIYLAVLSVLLIGTTIILGILAWLATLIHASSKDSYIIALLMGLIPLLIIVYQMFFWKETKKAQFLTLLTIIFAIITYFEFQEVINAFNSLT